MSNWINDALPELRETHGAGDVFARSANAIHLRRGNGVLGFFTGSPMHVWDAAEGWQALDTTLQVDAAGWYGAAGLPTRIHADGRVRLTGSDYEQFTPLPGNPNGQVDGDRIVRDFPGGRQELILTPGGFREQIWLTNPHTPALNFIASQQGNLPASYAASPMFATDAAGAAFTFRGDEAAFQAWLDAATYPVLLDPDFTAHAADGYVNHFDSVYAQARTAAADFSNESATGKLWVGQSLYSGFYDIWRSLLKFDARSIDDDATIHQANIALTLSSKTFLNVDFVLKVVGYDWSAAAPINPTNNDALFAGVQAGTVDANFANTANMVVDTARSSVNLSTSWVSKTVFTYYGLQSWLDRSNTAPTGKNWVEIYAQDEPTASYRPLLVVDYTPGKARPVSVPLAALVPPVSIGHYDTRIKLRAVHRDTALTTLSRKP